MSKSFLLALLLGLCCAVVVAEGDDQWKFNDMAAVLTLVLLCL